MIFLTVGTTPMQFDRLVEAIDECVNEEFIEEEIFAQVGFSNYKPRFMCYVEMLEKNAFDAHFRKASAIIGHAGMGTISMALEYNKPLLVMPRMKEHSEHVNDHQIATAHCFEKDGHVLAAYQVDDIPQKLKELSYFIPRKRNATPEAVADRFALFLEKRCVEITNINGWSR